MRVVVCGAGTSGCVTAARLSESPDLEVTLLEAGPHYRPGRWPAALAHSHRIIKETHDWGYLARAGISPRVVHVPRGRVVGGSSVTNGAIALRGHPRHYDEWDELVDGWSWPDWLPWLCEIENDLQFGAAEYHGDSGPIPVNRYALEGFYEILERFVAAATERGHGWVADHNAPGAIGVGPIPLNMVDGRRQTPADQHLDPALSRPNLTLLPGVLVDRVRLHEGRPRAVEVVTPDGEEASLPADCVVMALGTYATPAALMRSGIGPADELARHGIPVVAEVPALGTGMQDHPKIGYRFDLDASVPLPEWPHPWYQVLLTGSHEVEGETRYYQVMPYAGFRDGGHRVTDFNVQVADARGRRGRVRLQSRDPADQPVIDMGWFADPADLAAAVAAGERVMELAAAPALREVITPWARSSDPDHVLRAVETFHHPVGSCRMGREDDPEAVVDASGALRGVEGVHLVDASVMARVPSANTHLAVIALAERLSRALRERLTA